MSRQDLPGGTGSGQAREESGGLGFRALAMNEVAPVVATEQTEEPTRMRGRRWVLVLAMLAALGGGGWLLRSSLNVPPPEAVQQRFQEEVRGGRYAQTGVVQTVTFLAGDKVRVDFAASLNTEDVDARTTIRRATAEVMQALYKALSESRSPQEASRPLDRDLFMVGFQGDHEMANAHYLHRTAVASKGARGGTGQLDLVVNVEHGAEDPPMGDLQIQDAGPGAAGRGESSGAGTPVVPVGPQ